MTPTRNVILAHTLGTLVFFATLGVIVSAESGAVMESIQPLASIWDPCKQTRSSALFWIYVNSLFWGVVATILIALGRWTRNMLPSTKSLERTVNQGGRTVRAAALCARAGAQ